MGTMESEQFFLKWNNFENNLTSGFADLLQQEAMVDVTLAAEGKIIQAHKVILSICSSYFRNMFQLNPCQHPIVVLKDVGYQELTDMLDFMYKGEANVRQEDLPSFLKLAETLKVKGLAGSPAESDDSIKRSTDSHISNLTKYDLTNVKDELTSDAIEEDMMRKKRKRPISPYKNSGFKSLPYSQSIKLEIGDCDDPFVENNVGNIDQSATVKGERLSDSSLYSYEYKNTRNEKDAGPSNLDDGYETVPQGTVYRSSEFSFIDSSHGGKYLVFYGNCFRRKCTKGETSYWLCVKPKCKARGILHPNDTFKMKFSKHNHPSDRDEIEQKQKLSELKRLALESNASGTDLLKALDFKGDASKYLAYVRTWRYRSKKQSSFESDNRNPKVNVGLRYKSCFTQKASLIFHRGFRYRKDSQHSGRNGDQKYWRCCVRECRARGKTDGAGNFILSGCEHSHPPASGNYLLRKQTTTATRRKETVTADGKHLIHAVVSPKESSGTADLKKKACGTHVSLSPMAYSESFSIDKLMADTLTESFGVTPAEFQ